MSAPIEGFPAAWSTAARVLVLGSMPSVASLAAGEYYAHPRNAFWTIAERAVGAGRQLPYGDRIQALVAARIALWDVAHRCRRPGSLDAAIRDVEPNDVRALVARCPDLRAVLCNGRKAHELLHRLVLRADPDALRALPVELMPSTSPAYAGMPLDAKVGRWLGALHDAGVVPAGR